MLFVQDQAHMFSASTIAAVERAVAGTRAQTSEELVVVTVPSLAGAQTGDTVDTEAARIFAQRGVRGALLYVDREDRRDALIAQPASSFPPDDVARLRNDLDARFALGEYDAGLEGLATGVLAVYRERAAPTRPSATAPAPRLRIAVAIAALALAYFVIRGTVRSQGG